LRVRGIQRILRLAVGHGGVQVKGGEKKSSLNWKKGGELSLKKCPRVGVTKGKKEKVS